MWPKLMLGDLRGGRIESEVEPVEENNEKNTSLEHIVSAKPTRDSEKHEKDKVEAFPVIIIH